MVGGELTDADRAYDERRKARDNAAADRRERDKAARKRRIAARERDKASKPKKVRT